MARKQNLVRDCVFSNLYEDRDQNLIGCTARCLSVMHVFAEANGTLALSLPDLGELATL